MEMLHWTCHWVSLSRKPECLQVQTHRAWQSIWNVQPYFAKVHEHRALHHCAKVPTRTNPKEKGLLMVCRFPVGWADSTVFGPKWEKTLWKEGVVGKRCSSNDNPEETDRKSQKGKDQGKNMHFESTLLCLVSSNWVPSPSKSIQLLNSSVG